MAGHIVSFLSDWCEQCRHCFLLTNLHRIMWRCRSATQLSFMSRAGSYQLQQQQPGGTFPKSKSPVTKDKGKRREQQMSANVLNDS